MIGAVENNTVGAPAESELLRQGDGSGTLVVPVQNHLVMAEDEPLIRNLMQRSFGKVLPNWGFSAHENGEQTLIEVDLISSDLKQYLALVLSDQTMPPSRMRGNDLY